MIEVIDADGYIEFIRRDYARAFIMDITRESGFRPCNATPPPSVLADMPEGVVTVTRCVLDARHAPGHEQGRTHQSLLLREGETFETPVPAWLTLYNWLSTRQLGQVVAP